MEMKVMTFNLRYHEVRDGENAWPYRVDYVAKDIHTQNPLIFGTQEGKIDMLNELSEKLPEYKWVGQGRYGGTDDEFNAIFYKHEEVTFLEKEDFWLSETPSEPGSISWDSSLPRMCTVAHFKLKDGKEVLFYNTHLDHVGQLARENGIKVILDHMEKKRKERDLPVFLTGDFNSTPDNNVIHYLDKESLLSSCFKDEKMMGATFHGFKGGEDGPLIDYIYHSDETKLVKMEIDRTNFQGKYLSDHYPVWALFSL